MMTGMILIQSGALIFVCVAYIKLDKDFARFMREATEREKVHGKYLDDYLALLDRYNDLRTELQKRSGE